MIKHSRKLAREEVRILHIAYHVAPKGLVGALRNSHIIKELSAYSEKQIVLTARYKEGMPIDLLDEVPVTIKQIPNLDYRLASRLLPATRTKKEPPYHTTLKTSWTRQLMDSFPTNILLGEGGWCYIICGIIMGIYQIRKHRVTHLFSYYRSHADLLIAATLQRLFPRLYWVADFADTPIDSAIENVYCESFQYWCYRQLLRPARFITTVSEGHLSLLRAFHTRVHLLTNGITRAHTTQKLPKPPASKYFTMTYTGSLYGKRDPRPLFAAIREMAAAEQLRLSDLRLVYAGKDDGLWSSYIREYALDEIAITHQHLSPSAARELQRRSQINILLSWANPKVSGWLTYKLYEYLQANRPILSIITGGTDPELSKVIRSFNSGFVFHTRQQHRTSLVDFIKQQYSHWQRYGYTLNTTSVVGLEKYEWRNLVAKLWTRIGQLRVLNTEKPKLHKVDEYIKCP